MKTKQEHLVNIPAFIDSISGLSSANVLTGYWDNKRNKITKQIHITEVSTLPNHLFNLFRIYNSEVNSRKNCELRAYHRRIMERSFYDLNKRVL